MNSIRHAVPNAIVTARSRETRLAQAAFLFVTAVLGAVSCTDSNATEPLIQLQVPSGVAPAEAKRRPDQPAAAKAPLASMSAAAAADPSDYAVERIAFAPEAGPFTTRLVQGDFESIDDATWGGPSGFELGFNFTFFGTTYNKFWVGSNGAVMFEPVPWGACCYRWIPAADEDFPVNNMIALALTDLAPADNQISYAIRGSAPSRRLIVNFDQVPFFSGMGAVTTQAILFEGSNVIEIHTTSQDAMQEFTQGVENATGSQAVYLPGRNLSVYGLTNDAVRFTPVVRNRPPTADAGGTAGSAPKYYEGTEGVSIHFVGSGADADGDAITYAWDFDDDGIVDAETPVADFTFPDNKEYNATLTVQDSHGATAQASVWVKVKNAAPVVNVGNDARINAGDSVSFSGVFSDKGVEDALWGWTYNFGSLGSHFGTVNTQAFPLLSGKRFCKAGSFAVKLTVTDKNGDWGSDELVVGVDAIQVEIAIKPNNIVVNDKEKGMVTVEVYSRSDFDATRINPSSVKLTNGSGRGTSIARTGGGLWQWDVSKDKNGDGLRDAVAEFRRDDLIANGDLQMETTRLTLKGEVGQCGEVAGSAEVRVKVKAKDKSAGSSIQPSGAAATPLPPSEP
jgi:PKD domain-containing protein